MEQNIGKEKNDVKKYIQSNLPLATTHNVKDMWSLTGGGRLPEVRPQGGRGGLAFG